MNGKGFRLAATRRLLASFRRLSSHGETVCFLHIPKTGGTSIHEAVTNGVLGIRVCPIRTSTNQGDLSQLSGHDLVSGHFDMHVAMYLKKRRFTLVTQLRRPIERLASLYNFLRAHSLAKHPKCREDPAFHELVRLIKEQPPREFFKSDVCMEYSSLSYGMNNHIARLLMLEPSLPDGPHASRHLRDHLRACINEFDHVGFIDDQLSTINFIRKRLSLPTVTHARKMKETANEMLWHEWMEPVQLATPGELEPYTRHLIWADNIAFELARDMFSKSSARPHLSSRVQKRDPNP